MKLLVIEDDALLGTTLVQVLESNGYEIDLVDTGPLGFEFATGTDYDLILLDAQISGFDSIHLCRQLRSREYGKPILLLTADNTDASVVAGLDAGADDYIGQPCAPEVLLAKVRLWLRRGAAWASAAATKRPTAVLTWGTLCLDPDAGRVTVGEQVIPLTATEHNLLELFLRNPNRIFSRSAILDRLWSLADAPSDRAIVTHIKDVRKKLKAGGLIQDAIETVYGMGYRLKPAPVPQSSPHDPPRRAKAESAVEQVRRRFQGTFQEQVAVLEQAKAALATGCLAADLRQTARQEAHKLAGSLATFGYPEGSKLARSIEHLLMTSGSSSSATFTRFSELVGALTQALATALVTPMTAHDPSRLPQVLVIDDDVALTERLEKESVAWGCHLEIASTLAAARSRLALDAPDLVLLDLSFPEVEGDGLTLLQAIAVQSPGLPVIVFTGRDHLADRLAASRLGVRKFLSKPASTEQIFRVIGRVLTKPPTADAEVLIVDDDPVMLSLLANLLSPWGVKVTTLSNPEHFWDVLVATAPNLVLLDLEMPQVSGLELCRVVRQDVLWENVPLLVVTAHTDADSLQQAFAAGADDFIAKPVLGPELVTRVLSRIGRAGFHPR